jgi:hypothetical protein
MSPKLSVQHITHNELNNMNILWHIDTLLRNARNTYATKDTGAVFSALWSYPRLYNEKASSKWQLGRKSEYFQRNVQSEEDEMCQ